MPIAHRATASQPSPVLAISAQAVTTITPPSVRFADQRFKSPFVLKTSVMSSRVLRSFPMAEIIGFTFFFSFSARTPTEVVLVAS